MKHIEMVEKVTYSCDLCGSRVGKSPEDYSYPEERMPFAAYNRNKWGELTGKREDFSKCTIHVCRRCAQHLRGYRVEDYIQDSWSEKIDKEIANG